MNNDAQIQLVTFLEKAYELTRLALKLVQQREYEKVNEILDNRERAVNIIHSLSEKVALIQQNSNTPKQKIDEFNNQVTQVINKITAIDEIITSCLEHEKNKTQFEIAKTFKNKENFKGYNLNNLK